jgi:transcription antitermination factor NusG
VRHLLISQREILWYAFVTKPRHEKKVQAYLQGAGVPNYLPLRKTLNQWKDRKRWVEAPLFSSYIFCHIPFVDRYEVLQAPGMVRIVGIGGNPMAVQDREIDDIRKLLETGMNLEVRSGMIPGDYVKITGGILMGFEGQIVEERGRSYFEINIPSIGKSILVDARAIEMKKIA